MNRADPIPRLAGLVPDRLRPITRKIVLDGYRVAVDIGFHEFEVGNPQPLLVTVEVWVDEDSSRPATIPPRWTMISSGPRSTLVGGRRFNPMSARPRNSDASRRGARDRPAGLTASPIILLRRVGG